MRYSAILLALALFACDSTTANRDTTPPSVSTTVPADGTEDVAASTTVVITFSEPMDPGVTEVRVNAGTASGIWAEGNTVLTVDAPGGGWALQTQHFIEVPVTFKDAAGNPLARAYSFSFVTDVGDLCATDSLGPEVISDREPPPLDVGTDTYRLTFNEAVNLEQVDLSVTGGATIAGITSVTARSFDVELNSLSAATTVNLVVATSVTDGCSNPLGAEVTIVLAVEDPCLDDEEGPLVTSTTSPPPVPPGEYVYRLTFNEATVAPQAVDVDLEALNGGSGIVDSIVTVDARTYDVTLSGLADGDTYLLTVENTVADLCGNSLAETSVVLAVVDPCTADAAPPELLSDTLVALVPPADAYTVEFNESVIDLTTADVALSPTVGSGTIAAVNGVDGRTFEIGFTGLAHGDAYVLAILNTVEDLCGNRPAGSAFVNISVIDPCVADVASPVLTSPASVNRVPGAGFYRIEFDEAVAITAGDVTLTKISGPGAGAITSVDTVSPTSADVHLSGLADTDIYELTVAAGVADTCGNTLGADEVVSVTVMAPPAPGVCAGDHVELETFALNMTAPPSGWAGNTNGIGGVAEPWDTSNAEATALGGNMATDVSYTIAGLLEHFDPASVTTSAQASDAFDLGTWSGLAGREIEVSLSIDGADSSTTWGAEGAGYIDVALVDGSGMVVGSQLLTAIDTAGGSASGSVVWDTLSLVEGEDYVLVIAARPDGAPAVVGEHLDYCLTVVSRALTLAPGTRCSSSVDISGAAMPYDFAGTFTTPSTDGGSCDPTADNAVWFHYQPDTSGDWAIEAANAASSSWSRLAVFESGCDPAARTEVACLTAEAPEVSTTLPMTAGTTYYFVFYTDGPTFSMETPQVRIEACTDVVATATSYSPANGATGVWPEATLEVAFDTAVATGAGVISVVGDAGTDLTYDLATSVGQLQVTFDDNDTVMRLDHVPLFALGEHITVGWDDAFTDPVCGANPVAMSSPWEFDVSAHTWSVMLDASFDDASGMTAWTIASGAGTCSGGEPNSWTHIDDSTGVGCADVTSWFNGGGTTLTDGAFAVVNADCCGSTALDAELISASLDCSGSAGVELSYNVGFRHYSSGDSLTVDVSVASGPWQELASYTADTRDTMTHDLSAVAAGQSDVRIRFYYTGNYDYYALLDDVLVRAR